MECRPRLNIRHLPEGPAPGCHSVQPVTIPMTDRACYAKLSQTSDVWCTLDGGDMCPHCSRYLPRRGGESVHEISATDSSGDCVTVHSRLAVRQPYSDCRTIIFWAALNSALATSDSLSAYRG
jgi:hypothetical protein